MILTVTMNPSVDISYPLEEFNLDTVYRVAKVSKTPGGKGLNVTRVLKQLDDEVVATGLIGGALGTDIQKKLSKKGIKNDFFEISGETRNCIAILHEGNQTEILEKGPIITKSESENFLKHFEELVKNENTKIIAISGSLPDGLETNYYSKMIGICEKYEKPVVLDCSGKALIEVLKNNYKPKVIKPNTEELSQLIGKDVSKNPNELKEILKDKFKSIFLKFGQIDEASFKSAILANEEAKELNEIAMALEIDEDVSLLELERAINFDLTSLKEEIYKFQHNN